MFGEQGEKLNSNPPDTQAAIPTRKRDRSSRSVRGSAGRVKHSAPGGAFVSMGSTGLRSEVDENDPTTKPSDLVTRKLTPEQMAARWGKKPGEK